MKRKIYRSLDECPIWNWDKVTKENDTRYLFVLDSYADLPKVSKYTSNHLASVYARLTMDMDIGASPLIKARNVLLVSLIDMVLKIVEQSKDPEKISRASILLRGLMISDDPDINWLYNNMDMFETQDQRNHVTHIAVAIKKYQEIRTKKKDSKPQPLYEQIARIESMLGVKIDPKKCSVTQYRAYQKETITRINLQNKRVN